MSSRDIFHCLTSSILLAIGPCLSIKQTRYSPSQHHGSPKFIHEQPNSQINSGFAVVLFLVSTPYRNGSTLLTAKPQIGTLPTKQKQAPSASALKISVPLLIPPSIAMGIFPAATGAHSLKASSVAGALSNCLPPWLEIITPSRLY
jgi:hypothetical protein